MPQRDQAAEIGNRSDSIYDRREEDHQTAPHDQGGQSRTEKDQQQRSCTPQHTG